MGDLNKRRGVIQANEAEGDDAVLGATVPLAEMFGYSTALRSMTQVPPCGDWRSAASVQAVAASSLVARPQACAPAESDVWA